jgi:hypothetical protein
MIFRRVILLGLAGLIVAIGGAVRSEPVHAQEPLQLSTTYSNKRFQPAELSAAADRPIVLRIKNSDGKAMEFESKSLRVEKVVAASSEGIINVRPLKPGRYEFFDDFNPDARGVLVVK